MIAFTHTAATRKGYVRLDDASGYPPTAGQLAALESAACRLIDSLPAAFQDSFKVYDFGFYLHNETQQGGYPEAFQWAIDTVQGLSPYYLLFGKQTDRSGVYMRFWVDLRLPETGNFSCMTTLQREVYQIRVEAETDKKYAESQNIYFNYHEAEISGIEELIKIINEIKDCCVANRNGVEQRPSGCDGCSDEIASQFFQLQGFEKIDLNISTAAFANISTARVKDYSFHKVTIGSETDYLGKIMDDQVLEFNQWLSLNLLVTSYASICIDSISGNNLDAFKYSEDFNCHINFPSGEGLKPSDIKITWNKKAGSWIKNAATANLLIDLIRCKINRLLGVSTEDCFNMLSIPPSTANMDDMPEFDFVYAVYLQSLNIGVNIFDLIEGYKDFGGNSSEAGSDYVIIQNGIEVVSTSVAYTVPTTGTLIGFSRRDPPNVEDMDSGNGDCKGIIYDCMTCRSILCFPTISCPCETIGEEDLKDYMRNLMAFFSKDPLESIAVSFAERFFNKISTDHYATDLSEHVRQSPVMLNYMKLVGAELNKELISNKGDINLNRPINLGKFPPHFNGWYNRWHGLTILINNTETADVWYLGNFNLDNNTKVWSADFYFEVTDHFGLDKHDALLYQKYHAGFAAWWALQHRIGYKPFRTKITIFATLQGQL